MNTSILNWFGLPALLYVIALLDGIVQMPTHERPSWRTRALVLLALVAHGLQLFIATVDSRGLSLAITDSASLIGWIMAVNGWMLLFLPQLRILPYLVVLVSATLSILTGLLNGFAPPEHPPWELAAHIVLAGLAFAWFGIAVISAIMLMVVHRSLRLRLSVARWQRYWPALETIETVLFQALSGGFVALSLALLTGFFYVTNPTTQHLWHKIIFTVLAWITFAILLIGRSRYGWRAGRALRFTLFGVANLLLGYFGSKFVLELLLNRHWG